MAKIIPFKFKTPTHIPKSNLDKTDKQVIDAIEMLIEYADECGSDITTVIDSQELGDLIHTLHTFFGKTNHLNKEWLDFTKNIDISHLYNDQGYLNSVDKDEE